MSELMACYCSVHVLVRHGRDCKAELCEEGAPCRCIDAPGPEPKRSAPKEVVCQGREDRLEERERSAIAGVVYEVPVCFGERRQSHGGRFAKA